LGHAATVFANYDVKEALHMCEKMYEGQYIERFCFLGAMMEYTHMNLPRAPSYEFGPREDLRYPCNWYEEKFQGACAQLHVSYLFYEKKYSFEELFSYCGIYTGQARMDCQDELGFISGSVTGADGSRMVSLCKRSLGFEDACMMGIVRYFDTTGKSEISRQYCSYIQDARLREMCSYE
jgi:hypothetical protein